ncbi:MAG: aminotransferase class I/II-fold pyridoxal phosphate-dependent enzyme, partial [Rhizobiaceae bacterium]|nr:aminotransferase class I/II-fold pyridoxal phosphate-dependent enzyme [Rhizobiaceae bacterium]
MPERGVLAVEHGGSLERARALFPHAPEPLVDLSTGINPHSYPLFDLPATVHQRLPEPTRLAELLRVAGAIYGLAEKDGIVAAPGTQILLPRVMSLIPPGRCAVLGPTYAEHARAAAIAGHAVSEVVAFEALADHDLAVVVNPNNPDGRLIPVETLAELARHLAARGGLLVVDEAFMDVGPPVA